MTNSDDVKAHAQQRFGQYAQGYVESKTHAAGSDLDRLVELTQPQKDWLALDVATGGGHTTLKFAPQVGKVVSSDLTMTMLEAARKFINEQGAPNVTYSAADGENLPFASNSFDLVTCRIAPHHFPDCFRFVQECARVLKPGGVFIVQDHVLPDDARAGRYIDSFERLRDPSHHRAFAEYEWRGMFLDAGLTVEAAEIIRKSGDSMIVWAERQGCPPETIERLQVMLAQAPQAVAEWIRPRYVGTKEVTFDHTHIIIMGRK
jgi:ubiquinone/menaquinone biosynthesis C-methylase UbiE